MTTYQILQEEVDVCYRVVQLKVLYDNFVMKLLEKDHFLFQENKNLKSAMIDFEASKKHKKDYVKIIAAIMSEKKSFLSFIDLFPKNIIKLIKELIWNNYVSFLDVHEKNGVKIINKAKITYNSVHIAVYDDFQIFGFVELKSYKFSETRLEFPIKMREILLKYVVPPTNYYLSPEVDKINCDFIYENKCKIIQDFELLIAYYTNNDGIKTNASGQITISTANKLRKSFNFEEFYSDKNKKLQAARTYLLAIFIEKINIPSEKEFTHEIIKAMFENYSESYFNSIKNYLTNIKGTSYVESNKQDKEVLWILLRTLQDNKWYSMDKIIKYILLRNQNFLPVSMYHAKNYLYKFQKDDYYKWKNYVNYSSYQKLITMPIIKSTFAMFAAFGLVDIGYNDVDKNSSTEFETMYDELKYVRLTSFGTYVCGLTKSFEPPKIEKEVEFTLSSKELIVSAKGNLDLAKIKMKNFTAKNIKNEFIVTYESFLKNCRTEDDVYTKIDIFESTICNKPPQNWLNFTETILDNIEPFKEKGVATVFNIKNDGNLISILKNDDILRKYVFFTDKQRIMIEKSNVSKVKTKLRKHGYLL